MSAADDAAKRLLDLERILAQSRNSVSASSDADPVTLHMADVPVERIRRFTAELQSTNGDRDEIAAVTMRLLLNDYTIAVSHLRAVARLAVTRIEGAAVQIKSCEKAIRREHKMELKRRGAAAE